MVACILIYYRDKATCMKACTLAHSCVTYTAPGYMLQICCLFVYLFSREYVITSLV